MGTIMISLPDELEREMEKLPENWSKVASEAITLRILRKRLESKEEKAFTEWSVTLGKKINKGAFKRLLSELSSKERKNLIGK